MSLKKNVNYLRRRLFKKLTSSLEITQLPAGQSPPSIKRVLIIRPNHRLGNLLLITPLVQEVGALFPDAKIDLFVKGGLAPIIFRNYPNIDSIIQLPKKPFRDLLQYMGGWMKLTQRQYDIVINSVSGSSSGRLAVRAANSIFKFPGDVTEEIRSRFPAHRHIAIHALYSFRHYISTLGFAVDWDDMKYLDLRLSPEELEQGRIIRNRLVGNDRRTIGLYTFATGDKCYSETWWQLFYERLRNEFPEFNFIEVLPVENVSMLGFRITSYYSRDIREIAAVIAGMAVFISADSGIMHLGSAAHAPTVGLFSTTDPEVYRPYNKNSIAINTTTSTLDNWITEIKEVLHATLSKADRLA